MYNIYIYIYTYVQYIYRKLNKINTKKKAKSISTFDFTTLHSTIPHNLLIKVLSNQKLKVALGLKKNQPTEYQKVVEEDTSQDQF